jgi:NRAMP (natural resistance-associated macrophage protein)-like metal ion transporter
METKRNRIQKFWKNLGPGLVTGASDDDPSGIATYSQAGALFGLKLLWTAVITYPMMVAVQEMCARIGLVTKQGLTGTIKKYYPKYILYLILLLSFPSITLNIGADIAGMGAVANLLVPQIPSFIFSIVFTGILMYSIVFWNYRKISNVLKWLCLTLFSYIFIPFIAHTDWLDVLKNTLIPSFENSKVFYLALVGILGTTISPYLFFWQASMEVEESNQRHIVVDKRIISEMKADVRGGLVLTNVVFFFIILSTGTVLYNAGAHQISSVEDAARALKPLAGDFAYFLFALGVLGTGFLAIPVLAGSLSYMLAETFNWQEGLDKKFQEAKGFYITILISLFIGLMINAFGWNPIIALIYAAVLYGITAPVLILIILHICNNKLIMGKYVNGFWINFFGIITFLVMSFASFMLIYLYLV